MTTITNHQIIMDTITKSSQSPNHHHLHHLMVEVVEVWLGLSCDVGCRQPGARAFEKLYDRFFVFVFFGHNIDVAFVWCPVTTLVGLDCKIRYFSLSLALSALVIFFWS